MIGIAGCAQNNGDDGGPAFSANERPVAVMPLDPGNPETRGRRPDDGRHVQFDLLMPDTGKGIVLTGIIVERLPGTGASGKIGGTTCP